MLVLNAAADPGALTVRDLMSTSLVAVIPEMTVRELVQTFVEKQISGAPVLDPEGRAIGVVSTTDVMQLIAREAEVPAGQVDWAPALLAEEYNEEDPAPELTGPVAFTLPDPDAVPESGLDQYRVGDIMTPVAFTVAPSDPLPEVARFFLRGRVHRALVMEDRALVGIITTWDVLRALDRADAR